MLEKRGKKGTEIIYLKLKMQEYLLPDEEDLSIPDKQIIFAIRNRMINIEHNFLKKDKIEKQCICKEVQNMKHIYSCKKINTENITISYENIFGEDIRNMKMVYTRFKDNLEKIQQEEEYTMGSSIVDPLYNDYTAMNNKLTN